MNPIWVVGAGWLIAWVLLWRVPSLKGGGSVDHVGRVSVIVPARNEVDRIPTLLASLARQSRRPDEVIVVDDHSSDGTSAAAASFPDVRVIPAPELQSGWAGKTWACANGASAATGDVFVFADADVELAGDGLESALARWEPAGGLLSVQPRHGIRRPFEILSLPFNVVAMMGLGIGSLLRPRREWGAAGPFMVTDRASYEAVGGHSSVRSSVAEDLDLAVRYRKAGFAVRCLGGGDRIKFRMYRDLRSLVEGWSKNMASGAGRTPLLRALGIAVWIAALLSGVGCLFAPPGEGLSGVAAAAAVYGALAAQVAVLGRSVGRFGPAALVWPLLAVFFTAVFAWSVVRTYLLRNVRWSGRTLRLQRH